MTATSNPDHRRDDDIDPFVTLIAGLGSESASGNFYGELCDAICRTVKLDRAVMFQYDPDLRRVRPLGGSGIDPALFGDVYLSPDTATFVRDALERDAVVEIEGATLVDRIPPALRPLAEGRRAVCVPMISSERWVGLLLADRGDAAPSLTERERGLLLSLGKALALATIARRATRQDERTRTLKQRVDLAREVHDGVIQRLFGLSMALSGEGPLSAEDRARCSVEVEAAMRELRRAVQRQGADTRKVPEGSFAEELTLWQAAHADIEMHLHQDHPDDVAPGAAYLVRQALSEALRNARKHATPSRVDVRTHRAEGAVVVEIRNDGVRDAPDATGSTGIGLKLLGIEALGAGGVLEFGPRGDDEWNLRVVVPIT